jgi:hypothetical protein
VHSLINFLNSAKFKIQNPQHYTKKGGKTVTVTPAIKMKSITIRSFSRAKFNTG